LTIQEHTASIRSLAAQREQLEAAVASLTHGKESAEETVAQLQVRGFEGREF
jgi:hypothetical protein